MCPLSIMAYFLFDNKSIVDSLLNKTLYPVAAGALPVSIEYTVNCNVLRSLSDEDIDALQSPMDGARRRVTRSIMAYLITNPSWIRFITRTPYNKERAFSWLLRWRQCYSMP